MTMTAPPSLVDDALRAEQRRPRRLVIVVRADPVICGHSGEARNLAETALTRGFEDVRIVTWPLETLRASGLPLKPMETVLRYSDGIVVERPEPVGDYKVLDGRVNAGMVGRLVELFTDGVPTVCLSLYLMPHATVVAEALAVARSTGLPLQVTTIAEAVGSDITNVARSAVDSGQFGSAMHLFASYLAHDHCVAVSDFTRELIISSAEELDAQCGTTFADQCRARVGISYPAIDAASAVRDLDQPGVRTNVLRTLAARGLELDGYVLFLSRLTAAKGADDLIEGFAQSAASSQRKLVIAGTGPMADELRARAAATECSDRILFFDDVGDEEKLDLMAGCAAYALPSKPRAEFVETFGIALVEKMLAGGGPVITTATGGIPEAVGDTAMVVEPGRPDQIAGALDTVFLRTTPQDREAGAQRARTYAFGFDRGVVFDRLFARLPSMADSESAA